MTTQPHTDDARTNEAIDRLRSLGFSVHMPDAATLTPGAYAARLGLLPGSLSRMLHGPGCPEFWHMRGPTGRIVRMRPTPELEKWLLGRKRGPQNKSHGC